MDDRRWILVGVLLMLAAAGIQFVSHCRRVPISGPPAEPRWIGAGMGMEERRLSAPTPPLRKEARSGLK